MRKFGLNCKFVDLFFLTSGLERENYRTSASGCSWRYQVGQVTGGSCVHSTCKVVRRVRLAISVVLWRTWLNHFLRSMSMISVELLVC